MTQEGGQVGKRRRDHPWAGWLRKLPAPPGGGWLCVVTGRTEPQCLAALEAYRDRLSWPRVETTVLRRPLTPSCLGRRRKRR
jgi:hypothetical protein